MNTQCMYLDAMYIFNRLFILTHILCYAMSQECAHSLRPFNKLHFLNSDFTIFWRDKMLYVGKKLDTN